MMTRAELAFSALDRDKKGYITAKELMKLFKKPCLDFSEFFLPLISISKQNLELIKSQLAISICVKLCGR
jgi:Ca2+-binding EF-hand superfamily protein